MRFIISRKKNRRRPLRWCEMCCGISTDQMPAIDCRPGPGVNYSISILCVRFNANASPKHPIRQKGLRMCGWEDVGVCLPLLRCDQFCTRMRFAIIVHAFRLSIFNGPRALCALNELNCPKNGRRCGCSILTHVQYMRSIHLHVTWAITIWLNLPPPIASETEQLMCIVPKWSSVSMLILLPIESIVGILRTKENRKVIGNKHFRFVCDWIRSQGAVPSAIRTMSDKPLIASCRHLFAGSNIHICSPQMKNSFIHEFH